MVAVKNNIFELGRKQAEMFVANNVKYCELLVNFDCPRHILVMIYGCLVRQGKLMAIEDMLLEEKQKAWDIAKDIAKGRLGKKALVEVVQALLTIEYFLNL